ncbi:hypothetical protein MPRF_12360 [Mycolicibacterium parafortuitum]|uniref:Uncharacterized protein n=1 Tax=Mycolicibacterium parafortuitum TaxID=39692 RepID=A0A7I7TYQ7_MYCPF|nr:hypothetical protein [Mycolicibacterium parafortuitum]BBY74337.1 hypothetical protein MPRF_12360 [Mycolicibacterium parafortuitum]
MTPNEDGEVSATPEEARGITPPQTVVPSASQRRPWTLRDTGWIALGLTSGGFASWLLIFSGWEIGSKAEWFSGVASFGAVAVALWQSVVIRQQAKADAAEAAKRFGDELKAAKDRTIQEVQAAEQRTQKELDAANERHGIEMEQQREIARIQRIHLREQEFKLALIRVSRAATAYTHELATLVETGSRVVAMSQRQERADALRPVSKRLGALMDDLSVEIAGAHMLTNNDRLHDALDRVNAEAMRGPEGEIQYRNTVIMAGQVGNEAPLFMAMEALHRVIGDARRLAGEVLVTGWD